MIPLFPEVLFAALLLSAALWLAVFAAPITGYAAATATQLLAPDAYRAAALDGRSEAVP